MYTRGISTISRCLCKLTYDTMKKERKRRGSEIERGPKMGHAERLERERNEKRRSRYYIKWRFERYLIFDIKPHTKNTSSSLQHVVTKDSFKTTTTSILYVGAVTINTRYTFIHVFAVVTLFASSTNFAGEKLSHLQWKETYIKLCLRAVEFLLPTIKLNVSWSNRIGTMLILCGVKIKLPPFSLVYENF